MRTWQVSRFQVIILENTSSRLVRVDRKSHFVKKGSKELRRVQTSVRRGKSFIFREKQGQLAASASQWDLGHVQKETQGFAKEAPVAGSKRKQRVPLSRELEMPPCFIYLGLKMVDMDMFRWSVIIFTIKTPFMSTCITKIYKRKRGCTSLISPKSFVSKMHGVARDIIGRSKRKYHKHQEKVALFLETCFHFHCTKDQSNFHIHQCARLIRVTATRCHSKMDGAARDIIDKSKQEKYHKHQEKVALFLETCFHSHCTRVQSNFHIHQSARLIRVTATRCHSKMDGAARDIIGKSKQEKISQAPGKGCSCPWNLFPFSLHKSPKQLSYPSECPIDSCHCNFMSLKNGWRGTRHHWQKQARENITSTRKRLLFSLKPVSILIAQESKATFISISVPDWFVSLQLDVTQKWMARHETSLAEARENITSTRKRLLFSLRHASIFIAQKTKATFISISVPDWFVSLQLDVTQKWMARHETSLAKASKRKYHKHQEKVALFLETCFHSHCTRVQSNFHIHQSARLIRVTATTCHSKMDGAARDIIGRSKRKYHKHQEKVALFLETCFHSHCTRVQSNFHIHQSARLIRVTATRCHSKMDGAARDIIGKSKQEKISQAPGKGCSFPWNLFPFLLQKSPKQLSYPSVCPIDSCHCN